MYVYVIGYELRWFVKVLFMIIKELSVLKFKLIWYIIIYKCIFYVWISIGNFISLLNIFSYFEKEIIYFDN